MISRRLTYYIRAYRRQNVKWRGPRFEFRLYNGGSNLIGRSRCRRSPGPLLLMIGRLYICQSTGKKSIFSDGTLLFLQTVAKIGRKSDFAIKVPENDRFLTRIFKSTDPWITEKTYF